MATKKKETSVKELVQENKIAPSELKKFNSFIDQQETLLKQIGILKVQESQLVNQATRVTQSFNKFREELEKAYGKVRVDLQTGKFTEILEDDGPNKEN